MKQGEKHEITPQVTVQICEDSVQVITVYTPTIPGKFRKVGGDFDKKSKVWRLPKTAASFSLLDDLFGIDFHGENPTMLVRVDNRHLMVNDGFDNHKSAMLGGYLLAHRANPDWSVKMGKGVKKIAGDFARTHPQALLDPHPSTVVEIEVTKRFAKRAGLDKPLEERASTIQAFTDQELLAEVERRGLTLVNTTPDVPPGSADEGDDDDGLPF